VHARSITIQAKAESLDRGISHVRDEVMPTMQGIAGCIGLSMLVDRQSARCITTSAWQSEEAMRASEERVRPIREWAAEVFGGGSPQVDEWEIAVLHRDHQTGEGACIRVTWMQVNPAQLDRAIDVYKMVSLPAMEELDEFCSASLLVNRESGLAVSSATYGSTEAMERIRDRAASIRTATIQEAGAEVLEVGEFELAIAHLRVPEMA